MICKYSGAECDCEASCLLDNIRYCKHWSVYLRLLNGRLQKVCVKCGIALKGKKNGRSTFTSSIDNSDSTE